MKLLQTECEPRAHALRVSQSYPTKKTGQGLPALRDPLLKPDTHILRLSLHWRRNLWCPKPPSLVVYECGPVWVDSSDTWPPVWETTEHEDVPTIIAI